MKKTFNSNTRTNLAQYHDWIGKKQKKSFAVIYHQQQKKNFFFGFSYFSLEEVNSNKIVYLLPSHRGEKSSP